MKILSAQKRKNYIHYIQLYQLYKRFKDKEKFIKIVNEFKVHKSTIIFKIIIVKLIDKHLKLMKSSVTLGFLKNYDKDIKQISNENLNEFE